MKFPSSLRVFGDQSFRGDCPLEIAEQVTFVNWLRAEYPESYGALVVHIRNEGKRTARQAHIHKAEGMTAGALDIFIPVAPALLIEIKRRDHTKSKWQPGQESYSQRAQENGAFVCVALGADAAKEAVLEHIRRFGDANTKAHR